MREPNDIRLGWFGLEIFWKFIVFLRRKYKPYKAFNSQ